MTHVQNYGSDRLSLYTFDRLFKYLISTTNLKLIQLNSVALAEKYFKRYPDEAKTPTWTNPCIDKRHLEILPQGRVEKCKNLPDFIILGPQKTGTTALMNFLKVCNNFDMPVGSPRKTYKFKLMKITGVGICIQIFPRCHITVDIRK